MSTAPLPTRIATTARRRTGLAAALATVVVVSGMAVGCTAIAPAVTQAPAPVARTESAVKGALIEALGIDGAAVGVTVDDAQITLDGFVADERQRQRALDAARDAADGMRVVDTLQVRN